MRTRSSGLLCLFPLILGAQAAFAQDQALIIIDMQPQMVVKHVPGDTVAGHLAVARELIKNQRIMIQEAKRKRIPIMFVEYAPEKFGSTYTELIDDIKGYQPVAKIKKTKDGLFDKDNETAKDALKILKEWGTKKLLVMGINGASCVQSTIEGALKKGFDVTAYPKGIAHFNIVEAEYPFYFQYGLGKGTPTQNFREHPSHKEVLGVQGINNDQSPSDSGQAAR